MVSCNRQYATGSALTEPNMLAQARKIVSLLQRNGHVAYFAGGSVRDMLLGRKPKDVDIVTSATPDEVEALFPRTVPVGKQFGVVLVLWQGKPYEVATFRSDSKEGDGRRPKEVTFTGAEEDAQRRDFTINGMFYDPVTDKVLDYVGGKNDLHEKLVHFIGDPDERIAEDHLRILRAVRMVHQIGGQYHPATYQALKRNAAMVKDISAERVRDELNKMLLLPSRAGAFEDLFELGILDQILPELSAMKGVAQPMRYHREGCVWNHAMRSLHTLPGKNHSLPFLWAVLLHDVGKPETFAVAERVLCDGHAERGGEIAKRITARLKFPNAEADEIVWLVSHHMMTLFVLKMPKDKKVKWITHPYFKHLLALLRADAMGTVPAELSLYRRLRKLAQETIKKLPPVLPKLITGTEVIELTGLRPGKEVGKVIEKIERLQLKGKIRTRNQARKIVIASEVVAPLKKSVGRVMKAR